MDVVAYNKEAWNRQVRAGSNPWTIPVTSEQIAQARRGVWSIVLTEQRAVPADWFPGYPHLHALRVLCLASGGGQQGPILCAAGATVTVFDNSPEQLARDRLVAERDGLSLTTVEGDAADLSMFAAASFDLIVHPVSNLFMPVLAPIWQSAARVLRPGGYLLTGFVNPDTYVFDAYPADGQYTARYPLPYSDLQFEEAERIALFKDGPVEFSHTLEEQIGGQLAVGLQITGFYEDWRADTQQAARFMPSYYATRAIKR
jgi:SAM-dependent methyltransferase